jgi:RNA polymerase sigma-70 factor (ECF subfamily)
MGWGVQTGLRMLLRLEDEAESARQVAGYYPYHAARADLLRRTNQREAAAEAYERALALCGNKAERAYLQRRQAEMLNQ